MFKKLSDLLRLLGQVAGIPDFGAAIQDGQSYRGHVVFELRGPDGALKDRREIHNLITTVGDQYCAKRLYSAPAPAFTNMKLGSATTTPAKTGAGAFVAAADYIAGSARACDESSPKLGASADKADWIVNWPAGVATGTINRASITDNSTDAGEADASHTMATALLPDRPITKGALDTLRVAWTVTALGA